MADELIHLEEAVGKEDTMSEVVVEPEEVVTYDGMVHASKSLESSKSTRMRISHMESSDLERKDSGISVPSPSSRAGPPKRTITRSKSLRRLPGISLHVFLIGPDPKIRPTGSDGFTEASDRLVNDTQTKGQAEYWVHVDADERDRAELNAWIDELHLGSFISEQIKRPADEWMSHVLSTRSKALIIIRMLPEMDHEGNFAHHVEYLAAVMKEGLLMTYTTCLSGGDKKQLTLESTKYMTQDEILHEGSISSAVLSWLEFHVLRTRKALTQLRKNTMLLVKRLDVDPSNVHLHDILNVRDNVLVVLSVAEEQSQCLAMIRSMDEDTDAVDFDNLLGVVSVLVSTAASTELMCQRLEKRAKNLKDTYEALQQARLNKRLALLTVVSAIFMPLTFMAGVYGMNFDNMPELHYENGYFYLMGAMGFVVVSMVTGFWMNGWFE